LCPIDQTCSIRLRFIFGPLTLQHTQHVVSLLHSCGVRCFISACKGLGLSGIHQPLPIPVADPTDQEATQVSRSQSPSNGYLLTCNRSYPYQGGPDIDYYEVDIKPFETQVYPNLGKTRLVVCQFLTPQVPFASFVVTACRCKTGCVGLALRKVPQIHIRCQIIAPTTPTPTLTSSLRSRE